MIPVVVMTHGQSARALCESVKMIIGQQNNLFSIDFIPGENTEYLVQKIKNLNLPGSILFMVDFQGGSPFNAAAQYHLTYKNSDVVTGVNIPMLVNTLLEREENSDLQTLSALAKETAIAGIICMSTDFKMVSSDEGEL